MSLIYNAIFDKNTRKLSFEDKAGNEIYSFTVPERTPMVDDITKPLTFKATQDGSIVSLERHNSPSGSFQTSRDGGNTWVDYTIGDRIILKKTGDEVSFRVKADRSPYQYANSHFYFMMGGKIEAWHNVMSMYHKDDFATCDTAVGSLFYNLFKDCTSLTKAPVLPATTLLNDSCYAYMFSGCQSLTKAPELPATTLVPNCYGHMFEGCQSLTEAPELPATTLAQNCYFYMFSGCKSLKEVRIAATKTATGALTDWLKDVSATGDFYCDPNATIFPTDSASGIPKGWTRVDVDDPNKPLMLRAIEDNSSVSLEKHGTLSNTYQTSTDGTNWTDYTLGTRISLNKGESVYFRCSAHPTTQAYYDYVRFHMQGKIEAWHNAYSMISSSFTDTSASVGSYGMYLLFQYCEVLTKAPLLLNALSPHCYDGLFYYCSSLTQAPELPATTLVDSCYYDMFSGCQSLKEVRVSATKTVLNALTNWLRGVSATGDFYCNPNATIFPTDSASGIPANWTRHALADYPTT